MLTTIRNFFEQHMAERVEDSHADAEKRARIAAAALLVEVARSDEHITPAERAALLESIQRRFRLDAEQAGRLLALAETESHDAHDLFQFTSRINAVFSVERKERLVEELWRAAYADGELQAYEEHVIRRLADLLHVPHSTFIRAKLRVQYEFERRE
jgi:uncharacterized tellurite resistance protein B-like protein